MKILQGICQKQKVCADMEKILIEFIEEIFQMNKVPVHMVTLPISNLNVIDLGLREQILGIPDASAHINTRIGKIPDRTIVHWSDLFQCHYTLLRGVNPEEILIIGPMCYGRLEEAFCENLLRKIKAPDKLRPSLRAYYSNLKWVKDPIAWQDFCGLIAKYMWDGESYEVVHQYESKDLEIDWQQVYQEALKNPERPPVNLRFVEDRYEAEKEFLQAVSTGNESLAIERAKVLFDKEMLPRIPNRIRDQRNLLIALNTILRKQAEAAGVTPIHIDLFSNSNVQKIEQLSSMEQVHSFRWYILQGYCRLIRECTLSSYSLPIRRAITYMQADLTADLSLKNIASQVNVSPGYLSTLFSKEVGVSLTEYVNRSRIAFAEKLLENSDLPTKSIAFQCGISDICYFNRMFKRVTGMTPKVYREKSKPRPV